MVDVVVPLYRLSSATSAPQGVTVRRALAYERSRVLSFVGEHFQERWASEVAVGFGGHPLGCFIAIKEGKVCGFACFDCTFRGFFGPMGVSQSERGQGIGEALLRSTLSAMAEVGYAYAIIGGVSDALEFYQKTVGGQPIDDSDPGPYRYDLK